LNDLELIAEAIKNLNQHKSWIEEYMFPILGWMTAILAGYILTRIGLHITEKHSFEKEKLYTSNDLLIKVYEMVDALLSIKNIYFGYLTKNPVQRSTRIPFIPVAEEPMSFMLGKLSFIAQSDGKNNNKGWRDIVRISSLFHNYNLLLLTIKDRNKLKLVTNDVLLGKKDDTASESMTEADIISKIGVLNLTYLIDHTEHLITLVDGLLLEGNDFLLNFTKEIESEINLDALKKLGLNFLSFTNNNNTIREELFKLNVTLDFQRTAEITGRSVDEVKSNYDISQITSLVTNDIIDN